MYFNNMQNVRCEFWYFMGDGKIIITHVGRRSRTMEQSYDSVGRSKAQNSMRM